MFLFFKLIHSVLKNRISMSNTLSIIWLHAVWSTKNRRKVLTKSFRFKLFNHIKDYSQKSGIQLDIINGVEDHVHCLFRLKSIQSPSEIIKLVKGESSFWINNTVILEETFEWQAGYGIFSVSENDIMRVRNYIYHQERHHKNLTYVEELKRITPKNYSNH